MTIQQQLIDAIIKTGRGHPVIEARTKKYVVLRRPDGAFWYVGKSGALRVGRTVGGSVAVTENGKKNLIQLAAAQAQGL